MPRRSTSDTIGFRLAAPYLQELDERARALGMSPGSYAKKLLIETLQNDAEQELRREVGELRAELQTLRADVSTTLETVLINIAKVPKDDVRAFVREKLRS